MAYFCGLWFQWQFNSQRLRSVILVGLVYLVPLGLLLIPAVRYLCWFLRGGYLLVKGCEGPLTGSPNLAFYPSVSGLERRVLGYRIKRLPELVYLLQLDFSLRLSPPAHLGNSWWKRGVSDPVRKRSASLVVYFCLGSQLSPLPGGVPPTRGTPLWRGMSLSGLPSVARLGVGKDSPPPDGC